jgi:hypothetical protein
VTEVKILGQSDGGHSFLVDVGDGADRYGHPLARVYDRRAYRLFDVFPRDSILARGYWDDPSVDDSTAERIRGEVDKLV